jgi:AraC family transcriptional regulator, transcriptional activator of pobA
VIPDTPSSLRIVAISRLVQGGRWRVEAMRTLREPVLFWFTQGQGRITVAGTTRGYGPNQAIFVPPGVMHGFEVAPRVQGTVVFFGREHGLELPSQPQFLRPRDPVAQKEIVGLIENIQREVETPRPGAERAAQFHLGLVAVWIDRQLERERIPEALPGRPLAAQKLVARYAALLERDLTSRRSVAEFAAALGVTPTHLTRACRATCGKGAHALLEDRILFEARRLLAETRIPIKDVAERMGYASAGYFTRAFQRSTGVTPSAFRRKPAQGLGEGPRVTAQPQPLPPVRARVTPMAGNLQPGPRMIRT